MKKLEFETSKGRFLIVDAIENANVHTGIKLSEITEEQASEIVKMTWISDNIKLCKFKNYDINGNGSFSSATESLHSLLKSKGIHLFKNPAPLLHHTRLEKEQKTFHNPYIFKL